MMTLCVEKLLLKLKILFCCDLFLNILRNRNDSQVSVGVKHRFRLQIRK